MISTYLVSVAIFFAIDMAWLGLVAKSFYQSQIGALLRTDVNWVAAILFYLLFLVGLSLFAIQPALAKGSGEILHALLFGALFGFFTYMTYDLTNLATLKGWPLQLALVDIVWGTVLGGAVASATVFVAKRFLGL